MSTFVPDGTSAGALYSFEDGFAPDSTSPPDGTAQESTESGTALLSLTAADLLVKRLTSFLAQDPTHICLFEEDYYDISHDSVANDERLRVLSHGNELYYLLTSSSDHAVIEATIQSTPASWPGILGILTSAEYELRFPGNRISLENIDGLANRVQQIVVGAYDGEGYVVWTRRSQANGVLEEPLAPSGL
jgi:hypothetical protein